MWVHGAAGTAYYLLDRTLAAASRARDDTMLYLRNSLCEYDMCHMINVSQTTSDLALDRKQGSKWLTKASP